MQQIHGHGGLRLRHQVALQAREQNGECGERNGFWNDARNVFEDLRVGDDEARLVRLYGEGQPAGTFKRGYADSDEQFKDYTSVRYYDEYKDGTYLMFYLKDGKIVRIYLYVGEGC